MKKPLHYFSCAAGFMLFSSLLYAQPNISYAPASNTLRVGTAATLTPGNSGSAVPATVYGTVATWAPATTVINNPRGLTSDGAGNIYEADFAGNAIYKINSSGVATLIAGSNAGVAGEVDNNTGTTARFNGPTGIVYDGSANLYVTDNTGSTIRKISTTSPYKVTTIAGLSGTATEVDNNTGTSARFKGPYGIDYDGTANLYVTDNGGSTIRKISTTSPFKVTTIAGASGTATEVNNTTGTSARFNGPAGIVYDGTSFLYVTDAGGNTIRKVGTTGVFPVTTLAGSGMAGSANGTGIAATFKTPYGVTTDPSGNIVVADEGNNLIRTITTAGVVTTLAGSGAQAEVDGVTTAAQFYSPYAITNDNLGNLFVGDDQTTNSTIREITLTGYTISATALPAGITFNNTTGVFSGTPTAVTGSATYTVIGYNKLGSSTTTVTIIVNPSTPTISGTAANCLGSPISPLTASGGLPAGGTYNWYNVAAGGSVLATGANYTPTGAGTYYASYTASAVEGARSAGTAVTVSSAPALSSAPTTPTAGLYLSYPFTGNANDVSGNTNTGTVQGGATLTTDRYNNANSAYSFNGSTQYISTTTGSASPGPQSFSISVWFKTTTAGGMLVGYGSSQTGASSSYDRHLYMSNAGALVYGIYPGAVKTITAATNYADGNWHHAVAETSTTTGSALYVDGYLQAVDSTMTTSQVYGANGYWRIAYDNLSGWTSAPTDYYFTGTLDDIAVYNTSITPLQVYSLYGAGSLPACTGNPLTLQANTVAGATYAWTGPGGFTSSTQNPTVTATASSANAGTYVLTVTNASGCTTTANVTAYVSPLPVSTFTATSSVSVNSNATITYTGGYIASSTYTWNFNGGTIVSGTGVGPYTVKWAATGTKTVTLTVTTSSGCASTGTQSVFVGTPTQGTYAYSIPLTLNTTGLGISTDLTSFPFLVTITDPSLIYTVGGCSNKVMYPNGPAYDFAFIDGTSGVEVPYQIESYNQATGTILAWVKLPTLTHLTNNTLYFYYGSATAIGTHTTAFYQTTWASDYQAVYHFNEATYTGTVTDGTANGHTGTTSGMTAADLITAKVGTGYSFNGSTKKITANAVTITGPFTISAWMNISSISHDQKLLTNQTAAGGSSGGYKVGVYSDNTPETESGTAVDRSSTPTPAALTAGVWHYIQGVYTGSTLSTYVDGVAYKNLATTNNPSSTGPLYIGVGEGGTTLYFYGTIDEARVSNVSKTADWSLAEYKNQNNPSGFITQGSISTSYANASAIVGGITYSTADGTTYNYTINSTTTAGTPPADGTPNYVITGASASISSTASVYNLTVNSADDLNLNGQTMSVGCNIFNNGTINNTAGTASSIVFNGSIATQTYTGATGSVAQFDNFTVNNSAAGTITITGAAVSVNKVLTLTKGNLVINNAGSGALTLKSTATQSASVAAIPTGYSITGNVSVERFVTGGNAYNNGRYVYRNYRLMSSPVNMGVDASGNYPYSLNYVAANTIVTDCTSTFGTTLGNPSMYLYNEKYTPSNATFISGNFVGITNIANLVPSGNISTTDATNGTAKIYVGDGYMMYFRGDKTTNITGTPSKTTSPFVAPENVTFATTGLLNQGTYSVVSWTGTAGLMYTVGAGNTKVRGFNLVGNPYASSIDWSLFSNSSATASIYGPNLKPTVYLLNPVTLNYDTYTAGTGAVTGSATNVIPSGQGFFVRASGASPSLTFKETAKTSAQVSGASLFLGKPVAQNAYQSYMRLKLVTDTINYDDMVIGFNSTSTMEYNSVEDAEFLAGANSLQTISATTSDLVKTSVKWLPLPQNIARQVIKLNVNVKTTGLYTMMRTDLKELPAIYQVWLMDNYKKDSLDIRNNTNYAFNVNLNDTASFGANRFQIVIRENPALGLHLLNFTAIKATGGSEITWTTENEQNYTGFTVERSTDNGVNFDVLNGLTSSGLGTYSYLDEAPVNGADMYRLKLVDLNGAITHSKVITLMYGNSAGDNNNAINIYPNPAKTAINLTIIPGFNASLTSPQSTTSSNVLSLAATVSTVYSIKIVNNTGAVVKSTTTAQQNWQADVSGLIPGTYIIQVVNSKDNSLVGKGTFIKL